MKNPAELVTAKYGSCMGHDKGWQQFLQLSEKEQTSANLAWFIADQEYAEYYASWIKGEPPYNVFMSSTYAVAMQWCHDHDIYYLSDIDYEYASSRVGSWSSDYESFKIAFDNDSSVSLIDYMVSLYSVLVYLDTINNIK